MTWWIPGLRGPGNPAYNASAMQHDWKELLKEPQGGHHLVQLYRDDAILGEGVREYIGEGLTRGEAAIVIATPLHREQFGFLASDQMRLLDAEETLERFMSGGMPNWTRFHEIIGGLIAELRLRYPAVRAYGEMVNVLWQRGRKEAAVRLEEYWNDLGRLQTFSLLCAYHLDPLDAASYKGAHTLESICHAHSHLVPSRDAAQLDRVVVEVTEAVFEAPLAQMVLSLSKHDARTSMPSGQATLLWLKRNMPRSGEQVLARVRERLSPT